MERRNSFLLIVLVLFSSCSFFDSQKEDGVVTLEGSETTTSTSRNSEELSWVDAELLLAQCIRDNEYVLEDPQKPGDLRRILTPIFIEMNQEEREELSLVIEKCAEENDIPLLSLIHI